MARRSLAEAGAAAAVVGLGIFEAAQLIEAHGPGMAALNAPGQTNSDDLVSLRRAYWTAGAVVLLAAGAAAWLAHDPRVFWIAAGALVVVVVLHELAARRS